MKVPTEGSDVTEPKLQPDGVQVRRYRSVTAFAADAAELAAVEWVVVAQTESTGAMSVAGKLWGLIGVISFVGGLVFSQFVLDATFVALVCFVLAISSRRREFVVTYRHQR